MTDAELVRRVCAGETETYSGLVLKYRDAIFALAYHQLGHREDAQDVAQQAFLTAFERLDQLHDPACFGAWLRRIAISRCRMWQRRRTAVPLEAIPPVACRQVENMETRLVVEQALACLSDAGRLTLTLFYLRSLSLEEIATFLEVPVTTVKSRLRNARNRLRKELWEMAEDLVRPASLPAEFARRVMERVHGGKVLCVAFAPDGKRLVSGSSDTTVKLWDARSGELLLTLSGHRRAVDDVAFSADGRRIVSGSRDRTIRMWDSDTGELGITITDYGRPASLAFVAGGAQFVHTSAWFGANYQVVLSRAALRDTRTGQLVREIEMLPWHSPAPVETETPQPRHGMVTCIAGSPDSSLWATSNTLTDGDRMIDGVVTLWNAETGKIVWSRVVPEASVRSVAFSADGRVLAAACTQQSVDQTSDSDPAPPTASYVQLWEVPSGESLRVLAEATGCAAQQVTFSPDGRLLAVYRFYAGENRAVLFEWQTGKERQTFSQAESHQASIAFSPDGKTLASGAGDCLVIWQTEY